MSTRATLIDGEETGVHIYEELLDGTVHIEIATETIHINLELMSMKRWRELGLPSQHHLYVYPIGKLDQYEAQNNGNMEA